MQLPKPSLFAYAFGVALIATALPLWSAHYLPFVDIPQHLHLINVLGHLDDPNTLYPEFFKARGEITPYMGYYDTVWLFARVLDVFHANALFLTLVAISAPLAVGALARQLGGSFWIGILACPLFYGDNLYWGFINYCAALPLLFFAMALFVSVLEGPPHPRFAKEIGLGLLLVAVQLTHVQAFVYAGVALPVLLLLTPSDKVRRIRAVAATAPAVILFSVWSLGRLGEKPDIAPGQPWKAWGPLLSSQNLSFKPVGQNFSQLTTLLANGLKDDADKPVITLLIVLAVGAIVLGGIALRDKGAAVWRPANARGPLLVAIALAMFLFMPFDVRGYMYYVNYRFAELFALVLVAALPFPAHVWAQRALVTAATAVAIWYGVMLANHFQAFQREADSLDSIIPTVGDKPKIMALSFDTSSAVASHPVYLHAASYLALAHGGITSFSFASTAHSPLAYRGDPPPAPVSEWAANQFDYNAYGHFYDYYLVRAPMQIDPNRLFRGHADETRVASQSGAFVLYTRR
ncbi:MAG: hypothetical protein JST54_00645 [Deltaproteobacteria bacterium]|nr:hypothetical protein [Deltaproteobacteria bacterium]